MCVKASFFVTMFITIKVLFSRFYQVVSVHIFKVMCTNGPQCRTAPGGCQASEQANHKAAIIRTVCSICTYCCYLVSFMLAHRIFSRLRQIHTCSQGLSLGLRVDFSHKKVDNLFLVVPQKHRPKLLAHACGLPLGGFHTEPLAPRALSVLCSMISPSSLSFVFAHGRSRPTHYSKLHCLE